MLSAVWPGPDGGGGGGGVPSGKEGRGGALYYMNSRVRFTTAPCICPEIILSLICPCVRSLTR